MIKILLLSRYSRLGASSRVRNYQYIPYLEANGINITASPLFGERYLKYYYEKRKKHTNEIIKSYLVRLIHLLKVHSYDLLWIEKELFPFLPAWGEDLLKLLRIPYIAEYDDAVFHNYDQNPISIVRALLNDKIDKVMQKASLVIAGNDYLAERARRAGAKRVECLPSVVDLERYPMAPPSSQDIFTVGWIGSPPTAHYLKLVESALVEICKDDRARLVLVGSGHVELTGIPLEIRTWTEETEAADIETIDVGIMPLHDEAWERGKCGYKLIQYMACWRPVVASPVGANQQIIDNGVNGFFAKTTKDWVRALRALRENNELRYAMGKAARCKVETEYSLQVTAPRLLALLRSVL